MTDNTTRPMFPEFYPIPGDKIEITGTKSYDGTAGIVTGIAEATPAVLWLYVRTGEMRTVQVRPENMRLMKRAGKEIHNLARHAEQARREARNAATYAQREEASRQLQFVNALISLLVRNA